MTAALDHLVVGADSLAQAARWCEDLLGVQPQPGGRHVSMGTHNLLLAIASPAFPMAYLELIAIDPQAPPPSRPRWFGLDDEARRAALRQRPRLLHAVARSAGLERELAALAALGFDAGRPVAAERDSAAGLLRWRIAGRDDGQLLCGGALPTLIEWLGPHPSQQLAPSAVALTGLSLGGLPPPVADALGLPGVKFAADGPALAAGLQTPRGPVTLSSDA